MKKICFTLLSVFFFIQLNAQKSSDYILQIDGQKISKEEFVRLYEKNRTNLSTGEITSVDSYLDLFINFKLKVLDAKDSGIDTTKLFVNEFEGYREQLAKPYLIDKEKQNQLVIEAYDRMQYEVRASHILIKLDQNATAEDTVEAYNKAMEIRRRILNGEDFEIVARGSSDDPSVKNNGGDLGYFTVFQMVYPFETAAYTTKINDISMPVRTRFGYHLVKVVDKRKAQGEVKVAHIMLAVPRESGPEVEKQKKQLINEIYHKIKQGNDFAELAKEYSDDKGSGRNGGELPWFGVGRMVPEFEKAAFELKTNGEVSLPVRTGFGWHILKRIDRKEILPFNEVKNEISNKVSKDQRAELARETLIQKLKSEYKFTENEENKPVWYDTTRHEYMVNPKYISFKGSFNGVLFTLMDRKIIEKEYVEYVNQMFNSREATPYQYYLAYNNFKEKKILEIEESMLESKYPEYKYLLKEYHDGMLLFEITDRKVWSKAMDDSLGMKDFYKENRKNYMWGERWEGTLFFCSDQKIYDKVEKIISKRSYGKKITERDLLDQVNKQSTVLRIEKGLYRKGDNQWVDYLIWNIEPSEKGKNLVLYKGDKIPPKVKSLDEAKGQVISDYQDYMEKQWVNELRNKHNILINEPVLSEIKKKY